jgi:hypothetical protein
MLPNGMGHGELRVDFPLHLLISLCQCYPKVAALSNTRLKICFSAKAQKRK